MRKVYLLSLLQMAFLLLAVNESFTQDTLIKYGQNLAAAPQWKYKGGGANLNTVNWKDLTYTETGWLTGNSALGFGASAPVRNTAIPENTTAGGGGVSGARYPTMYFRKILTITNPSMYTTFRINAKFDDAIVVWVNGQEAYRNNIAANPAYASFATGSISNNNGATPLSGSINTSLFVAGDNIIAVEIHQVNVSSSDLFFDMELIGLSGSGATVVRNPYLQMGTSNAVTLRWNTDMATNSRVRYGTTAGSLIGETDSSTVTKIHQVRISGLAADTKYFYEVGEFAGAIFSKQQGATDNYFTTMPTAGTSRSIRIVAFGDCGRNEFSYQSNTLNAYKTFVGSPSVAADAWLLLGDNAYNSGLAAEYDANFFGVYGSNILKNHVVFPVPGNHDYSNLEANKTLRSLPYYSNFTLPSKAECGGVASNTEAYYSYDIGDIHFLALDSYGKEGTNTMYDTLGPQAVWVKADLAANTKKWVIAYWHHPPYTFGSHTSDGEADLQAIRNRFITILERNGVDMIINGHSHAYERSYLLKGFFGNSNTFSKATHAVNASSGKYEGSANSCPYTFSSGKVNHGTVYVVAGSSGAGTSSTYAPFNDPNGSHPFSLNTGGCFIMDIQGNRLDAKFLRDNGTIGDRFTIMKDVQTYKDTVILTGQSITLNSSWIGGYNWINNAGATTSAITITPPLGLNMYRVVDSIGSQTCLKDSFRIIVSSPLAVKLVSYSAKLLNQQVAVNWITSMEQDNNYFMVDRSADGKEFYPLAKIISQGNNSTSKNYQFEDDAPLIGTSYYRLSQTSKDGSVKSFGIMKIVKSKAGMLQVITATGIYASKPPSVTIRTGEAGSIAMKVIDMNGREISKENFNAIAGDNPRILNVPAGTYIIDVRNANGSRVASKILVQ